MSIGAKVLMISSRNNREGGRGDNERMNYPQGNYPRSEYDGARMDYGAYSAYPDRGSEYTGMNYGDTEARFRDRRGREHYDNGRFAPRGNMEEPEENYGPESRRYRRDDAGRFRSEYPYTPLVPPVYRGDAMNRIGFAAEPETEIKRDYRTEISNPRMDEMGHRTSVTTMGHAKSGDMMLTEEMADEWMRGLHNEDGTKGPHWTKEQTKQVMNQKGIKVEPLDFWVIMNALYADYCSVLKKHNVNNIDFYVDMTCAWLNDKDVQEGKTARYFQYITK